MLYTLSKFFQKGVRSQILFLIITTLTSITIFSLIFIALTPDTPFWESLWIISTRMLDPGTFSGDEPSFIRWVTYPATIFGILIMSTLIGILSASLTDHLIQLRRGIGKIDEDNYTLIIGWDYRVFHIIEELCEANLNQNQFTIVILANKDKIEMDEEISVHLNVPKKFKIITRRIDPMVVSTYRIIDPQKARAVILLTPIEEEEFIISKYLLVLNKLLTNKSVPVIFEVKNKAQLEFLKPLISENSFPIDRASFYSKTITQTSLQSGLSNVFSELFSFRGNELYLISGNDYQGKIYGDILLRFKNASLIGVRRNNETVLNPDHSFTIIDSDQLIVVMDDDEPLDLLDQMEMTPIVTNHHLSDLIQFSVKKIMILGWNSLGIEILSELGKYVKEKISIEITSQEEINYSEIENRINPLIDIHWNKKTHYQRVVLESLNLNEYDKIIILSSDRLSPEEADSVTISTLLHTREIIERENQTNLISQIRVEKNVTLLEDDDLFEFIVSDSLVSGLIAQIAENSQLFDAQMDLLDEAGAEIYALDLKMLENILPKEFSVLQAYTIARDLGGSMIGYQSVGEGEYSTDKVTTIINPSKSSQNSLSIADKLLVVCDG